MLDGVAPLLTLAGRRPHDHHSTAFFSAVSPQNHNPLRADPGGLISDTDVVLGHAQVLREVTENGHIDESATMTIKFGSKVR